MTLSSRLKRIIQSPACFGPSPTLDDPKPSPSRRAAPAAPPGLQSRGPQPGAPAQRVRRHWYSLKRSPPQGPQPTAQQPTGANLWKALGDMAADPAPARPQPGINTWAALDRMASEQARIDTWGALDRLAGQQASAPRRERTRPTLAKLLATSEPPSPGPQHPPHGGPHLDVLSTSSLRTQSTDSLAAGPPSGPTPPVKPQPLSQDRLDAQASFDRSTGASPDQTQHGAASPHLSRSITLHPRAAKPSIEATPPAALPEAPPPRSRRTWPKLRFPQRHTRPAEAAGGARAAQAVAPALTEPPLLDKDPSTPHSPVALQRPAGPVFDESRPSSLRIHTGPQIEPSRLAPPSGPAGPGLQSWPQSPDGDSVIVRGSFDRRTSDSQDPTLHGPVNRRFWNSLTLPAWAILQPVEANPAPEDPPAAAPETRRSIGAEVLRVGGVLASHTARQVVATGTSTLVREGVNIGIAMGLRHQPGLAAGLTLSMTLMNLLAQLQREKRVLRAPDEAARGFHSLSPAQWQAASPEQQEAMRQEQQVSSRRVTKLHLLSNLITTSIAMVSAARPGGRIGAMVAPMPSVLLGQMARQWAYVGLRDGLQATFTTVQTSRPATLPNIEQRRMRTAGATYGGAQSLLGYAQEAIMPRVLGALSQGSNTIRASGGLLSSVGSGLGQWARTIAAVAGVRAGINVVGETLDDVQLTHHDAAEAGGEQVPGLDVRALDPARRDYGRLLDHAMVRVFANDVVGGVMNAVSLATGQLPAHFADVASLVGNFGVGYLINLTYPMIGNNFAAAGLVRKAVHPPPPLDLEAGSARFQYPSRSPSLGSQATSHYRPEA